jgi:hypothetical protein
VHLILAAFPTNVHYLNARPRYVQLLSHALAAAGHTEELGIDPEATAELLNRAGLYLWQRADHGQARALLERALAIREAHLGADHSDTVTSHERLAAVLAALENRRSRLMLYGASVHPG